VAPGLAAEGAIVVKAPVVVSIRVNVDVVVADIDYTGTVADDCARRINALLDPESGGFDGLGWPLGQLPSPGDVSACLDGVKQMTDLVGVTITKADGTAVTSTVLHPQELASLVTNGVRVTSIGEVAA
jgi:hypothetical protein